jgi:hypothetical protein
MTSSETPALTCPKCGSIGLSGDRAAECPLCGAHVHRFREVAEVAELGSGEGRCAVHPARDAVHGCGRCGAFVCELCRTRTGDQVLCPPCFDALHERGELSSTKPSRFRIDEAAVSVLILLFIFPLSCIAPPISIGTAVWGLVRSKRERWISRPRCISALVLNALVLIGVALVLLMEKR